MTNTMEFHPVANIFPLLQGQEFEDLKADIATNGLIQPIWMHPDGRIIDGRNRWRACVETGTNADFEVWDESKHGSLVSFVVSLNLKRRHLDSSQRATIAVEVLPMLEEEARERQGKRNDLNGSNRTSVNFLTEVEKPEPQRATQQAADLLHTNRQYVSDAKKIKEESPEIFEQVKNGDLTIPKAKLALSQPMQVMLSHNEIEYYTPKWIIELAHKVMGQINLDPASCASANKVIRAETYFTTEQNGLSLPWFGKVWLNPPYSKTNGKSNQELWSQRLISEYEAKNITEGILLVKSALGYKWFEELWDKLPACFVRERLSFTKSSGSDDGESKHGTAIFYLGKNLPRFIEIFSGAGRITTPAGQYINAASQNTLPESTE